jgi:hypothetical protein
MIDLDALALLAPPHGEGTVALRTALFLELLAELRQLRTANQTLDEALIEMERAGWPCRLVEAPGMIRTLGAELRTIQDALVAAFYDPDPADPDPAVDYAQVNWVRVIEDARRQIDRLKDEAAQR